MFPFFANNTQKTTIKVQELLLQQVEDNIALSWSIEDHENHTFEIYRSEDGTSFTQIGTTALGETTYTDLQVGLNSEKDYWYYVSVHGGTKGVVVTITTYYTFDLQIEGQFYKNSNSTTFGIDLADGNSLHPTYIFEDGTKSNHSTIYPFSYTGFDGSLTSVKVIVPHLEVSRIQVGSTVKGHLDFSRFTLYDHPMNNVKGLWVTFNKIESFSFPDLSNCSILQLRNYNLTRTLPTTLILDNPSWHFSELNITFGSATSLDISNLSFDTKLYVHGVLYGGEIILPNEIDGDFSYFYIAKISLDRQFNLDFGNQFKGNISGYFRVQGLGFEDFIISDHSKFKPETFLFVENKFLTTANNKVEISFGAVATKVGIVGNDFTVHMMDGNYEGTLEIGEGHDSLGKDYIFENNENDFSALKITSSIWAVDDYAIDLSNLKGSFEGGQFILNNSPDKELTYPSNMGKLELFQWSSIETNSLSFINTWHNWLKGKLGSAIIAKNISLNIRRSYDHDIIEELMTDIYNNIAKFPLGEKTLLLLTSSTSLSAISHFNANALAIAQELVSNHDYTITYWNGSQSIILS